LKLHASLPPKVTAFFRKYQYALLVLLAGICLLMIPSNREKQSEPAVVPVAVAEKESVEEQLETLLTQVDGAGRVSVMLTVAEGERTVLQTDLTTEERTGDTVVEISSGVETVFSDAGGSKKEAIPVQTLGPVYQGAVVVAEGADLASVRLNLTNAVMSLTGLSADKITVIKMKMN